MCVSIGTGLHSIRVVGEDSEGLTSIDNVMVAVDHKTSPLSVIIQ